MAMEMTKLISAIENIMMGSGSVDVDINDVAIQPILADVQKARIRLELSHHNIAVDFPKGGSTTMTFRRILDTAQPANPTVPVSEKKAKAPTATPTLKRNQHTYVEPPIAKDVMAVLQDTASHVIWLQGPTQCLAGETPIRINRAATGAEWTIKKLYDAYQGNLPRFKSKIPTMVRSFNGETIQLHKVLDVVHSGFKPVFILKLMDGKSVRLTSDHPVMTKRGFVKSGELTMSDEIMVDNFNTNGSGKNPPEKSRRMIWNVWNHPFAHKATVKGESRGHTMRIHRYRAVYEANLNGMTLQNFVNILRTNELASKGLKFIDPSLFVVHHKNGDCQDDSLANLELASRSEHAIEHKGETHFGQGIPEYVKMESFTADGETDVYDIKCEDPHHNFVAGGIVVHNCGKDKLVDFLCREMNRRKYQINCHGRMSGVEIFGQKTIIVDPKTQQNIISFQAGQVEQFLKEGLDDQGNEVGPPGILFINEAAAMPAHVAIGMNRLLESDDPRRTFVIDQDGGRVIRGHSGARIIFASNTVGRGATSMESSAYTAQTDALDISLLNRMAVCFQMGYSKDVEQHILAEKIGDDRVAALVIKFRDAIRDLIRTNALTSPFSTAHIVHIADMYRVFGDLGKAIYYVNFGFIMPEEKAKYNEVAHAVLGKDLLGEFATKNKNVDFM